METCFIIQPFDNDKFDKRCNDIFKPAIRATDLKPYRVDEDKTVRVLMDGITTGIRNSKLCFADITLDNPNVWYELGFAFACGRDVVMVCSDERKGSFPFDIQHRPIIRYNTGSPSDFKRLRKDITEKLKAYLGDHSKKNNQSNEAKKSEQNGDSLIDKNFSSLKEDKSRAVVFKQTEHGVGKDEQDNHHLFVPDCNFFYNRLVKAFPGIRELTIMSNPPEIIERLKVFFKRPLIFKSSSENARLDPIWWFRGRSNMYIYEFEKLADNKILLNVDELIISKIAVYNSSAVYRSFIYVETEADIQTGVNKISQKEIEEHGRKGEDYTEEFGVIEGKTFIKREEYDDGAAVIEGKLVDAENAVLRVRHLTPFNFVITCGSSPINSNLFDTQSKEIFNGILLKTHTIKDLVTLVEDLPRYAHEGGV
jgi:hypothetical protein